MKANSEGKPGPCDYGRTHVDGANMLADALRPYGGIVMWRSLFIRLPVKTGLCRLYWNLNRWMVSFVIM